VGCFFGGLGCFWVFEIFGLFGCLGFLWVWDVCGCLRFLWGEIFWLGCCTLLEFLVGMLGWIYPLVGVKKRIKVR